MSEQSKSRPRANIAGRLAGVALQAISGLLIPLLSSSGASDDYFAMWSLVQISSVIGQFGNGWKSIVRLSQGNSWKTELRILLVNSIVPATVGLAVFLSLAFLFQAQAGVLPLALGCALFAGQTLLLLLADFLRGTGRITAGNFVGTGAGNVVSAITLLIAYLLSVNLQLTHLLAIVAGSFLLGCSVCLASILLCFPEQSESPSQSATSPPNELEGRSSRAFLFRMAQLLTTQSPAVLLNRFGSPLDATIFAIGQRFAIATSILVVNAHQNAPVYLARLKTSPDAAIRELRRLSATSLQFSIPAFGFGLICLAMYQAFAGLPSSVLYCYTILSVGQVAILCMGVSAPAVLFFFKFPVELAISAVCYLLFAIILVVWGEMSSSSLATCVCAVGATHTFLSFVIIRRVFKLDFTPFKELGK